MKKEKQMLESEEFQKWMANVLQVPLSRVKIMSDFAKELSPKEFEIMVMRGNKHTLKEVGEKLGLTRERIRQIEAKIICKAEAYLREH